MIPCQRGWVSFDLEEDGSTMLGRYRGKGYKYRLLNPWDEFWDRRLRLNTFGFGQDRGDPSGDDYRVHYEPTPYRHIFRLLRMIDLRKDDVFVDLGCGMGRPVFAASWLGAASSIGVEVSRDLYHTAVENRKESRLAHRDIRFYCQPAQEYRNPDMTVLFMAHPFGERTLAKVISNAKKNRSGSHSRSLRIVYVNPLYDVVLERTKWLERICRAPGVKPWPSTAGYYETSIWQAR
jgi:SAM-dependent methyltransferase